MDALPKKVECQSENSGFCNITTLIAYKTFLETQNLKPNAINPYLAGIKGVIKCSWQMGLIEDHQKLVLASVKRSRGSRLQAGRALTPLESGQLIDSCLQDGDAKGVPDAAIISIAIGCGLRRSEISAILIKNVNFTDETISVIGKCNKERLVGAPPVVFVRLKKWLDIRGTAGAENLFVCINKYNQILHDKIMSSSSLTFMLKERAKEIEMSAFSPHDLRRTFATRLLDSGADLSIVKEAMGHASVQTTLRYDKRGIEKVKKFTRMISI